MPSPAKEIQSGLILARFSSVKSLEVQSKAESAVCQVLHKKVPIKLNFS